MRPAAEPRRSARRRAPRACAFAAAAGGNGRAAARAARGPLGQLTGTPVERDPFAVPLADKVALCLRAEEALRHPDVKVDAGVRPGARASSKLFLSSDGAEIDQELVECGGGIDAMAIGGDGVFQVRSYPSAHVGSSAQAGWEYVESLGLEREAPRVAEQAAALLRADECPAR